MMNFTFNFFYPFVTAFTTLWAATSVNHHFSQAPTGCSTPSNPTIPQPSGRSRRTRPQSAISGSASNRPASLRRSGRLQHKYVVPQKPILSTTPRRRRKLRREGAIADLQCLAPGNLDPGPSKTRRRLGQLKREDSFILVDYGDHFRMVKPAYAKHYCHSVPENIRTVAPFHALGPDVWDQELRDRLLAVPIPPPPIGADLKRVRFKLEEEEDVDGLRPRKRLKGNCVSETTSLYFS